jgi:phosphatidylglycerol:prolipoprotein diacylglycerol transferase
VQEALPNGLTMGMVLSLPLVLIGAGALLFSLRRRSLAA